MEGLGLQHYDTMVLELANCREVDEVKEIRDQAIALETYAKQAMNLEVERSAREIRIRAERRAGELLKVTERSPIASGGNTGKNQAGVHAEPPPPSDFQKAKTDSHISDTQAKRWQKLADVPQEEFEEKLKDPLSMPSTTAIIEEPKEEWPQEVIEQGPDEVIWLWGQIREFEKVFESDINEMYRQMSPALQEQTREMIPRLIAWLSNFEGERSCKENGR